MSGPVQPLDQACPDLDRRITALIGRMLSTEREHRPGWLEPVRDEFQQLRIADASAPPPMLAPTTPARLADAQSATAPTPAPPDAAATAAAVTEAISQRSAITRPPSAPIVRARVEPPAAVHNRSPRSSGRWAWAAIALAAILIGTYAATMYRTAAVRVEPSALTPPPPVAPAVETSPSAAAPPIASAVTPSPPKSEPHSAEPAGASAKPEPTPPRSSGDAKRCTELLEKLSLGETLTRVERDFQTERCGK
jgi:hypothetical protein